MDNDQETDEFMRRLVAAAPGLSEEQIESIRRVVATPEPSGRDQLCSWRYNTD
jgi:hypothetical protein